MTAVTEESQASPETVAAAAPEASETPAAARPDWPAIRAAEQACADCHPDEVESWRASPMGRSLRPSRTVATPGPAEVTHPQTAERFTVDAAGTAFAETGGLSRLATHVVGSGSHTRSFVHVFSPSPGVSRAELMPLTWYRAAGWGLSPGYEVGDHPGFRRAINLECLSCHDDPVPTAPGTDDRFTEALPDGIGCARCHGDGRAHVAARLAGTVSPMVMPGRLSAELGADVCGQCHLQGAVRLLRAGRRWDDVLPGQPLGEVIAVFARRTPGAEIGIASHAERLRRSRCVTANPEAGRCTTCHVPHPTGEKPDRSAGCRGCHGETTGGSHAAVEARTTDATQRGNPTQAANPTKTARGKACAGPGGADCASCHMARSATADIPHVSMTDHFIRRRPAAHDARVDHGPLEWINRPDGVPDDVARRLLGRAWAESARTRISTEDRNRAIALLEPALETAPDDPSAWADLASMKTLAGDSAGALTALEQAVRRAGSAGARAIWWADLARLRLQAGALDGATAALDAARALRPNHPDDLLIVARIAAARGDGPQADEALAAHDRLRPDVADGHLLRGALALAALDPKSAEDALATAAAREPGDARAWLNLCRLRADRQAWAPAGDACERAMRLARGAGAVARVAGARARVALGRGELQRAAELAAAAVDAAPTDASLVLGRLAARAGRLDDALGLLDRAVRLEPTTADGWAALAEVLRQRGETALAERAAAQARRLGAP